MQQDSAPLDQSLLRNELNVLLQSFGCKDIYHSVEENKQSDLIIESNARSDRELQAALDLLDVAFERVDLERIDIAKARLQIEAQKALYEAQIREHRRSFDELKILHTDLEAENARLRAFIDELHTIIK